jgi:hypothetical protein
MEKEKTRNLSTYEYLEILQVEYIVAELRRKIYVKKKDKTYYSRVLEGKERKIKDICQRNSLPSVFEDSGIKSETYPIVYPTFGYPDFHYKNDEQIMEFKAKDFYYYYHKGSDFRVNLNGSTKVGTLCSIDEENGVAYIKLKGEELSKPFTTDVIARIL